MNRSRPQACLTFSVATVVTSKRVDVITLNQEPIVTSQPPPPKSVLEESIDELLAILRRATTVEVCGYVSAIWMKQGPEAVKDTGLSSPQRQTFYLLGLLMTTPESDAKLSLSKADWKRVFELLNAIVDSYVHSTMEKVVAGDVDPAKAQAASLAFLQFYMSGRLAVAEQLVRLIEAFYVPFDDRIHAATGISATEALEMVEWLKETLIALWEDGAERLAAAKTLQSDTVEMLFGGPESYDEKLAAWQTSEEFEDAEQVVRDWFDWSRYPNCVPHAAFAAKFGEERTAAFLRLFALRRGGTTGFRYFASSAPSNPAELSPLFVIEGDRICAPMHAMLYNGLYDSFDDILRADHGIRDRYLKKRSDYLEVRANALIASLFPQASVSLNTYYETPKAQFEHDGLLLAGDALIVVEEKSSEMKTPSRDPERYFERLTQHFKSNVGIQHGYEQANRVIDLVSAATERVPFYDENGAVIATIDPKAVRETFAICVTLESFGMLASDLTMMLKVQAGKEYPWVVNLFDLETLVDGFLRKGLTGSDFLRYLRHRRAHQGRVVSDDELNITGQFIVEKKLPTPPPGTVHVVNDYANIFDDLYLEQHGVKGHYMDGAVPGGVSMDLKASLKAGKPVFVKATTKVGRNKQCPCGSHKKYKSCCGRVA